MIILSVLIILLFTSDCSSWRNHISPVSAGQISREDLITILEKSSSSEERKKLLEDNRDKIDSYFITELIWKAHRSINLKDLSSEKSEQFIEIAVESAEIKGDKISLARALIYKYKFALDKKKNEKSPELEQALVIFKEKGNRKGEGICYYYKAVNFYYHFGKTEEAFLFLDKSIKILRETGDSLYEGDCYRLKGEIYRDLYDSNNCINNMETAIKLYEQQRDTISICSCYQTMFEMCQFDGLLKKASEYLETKRQLIERLQPERICSGKEDGFIRYNHYDTKEKLLLNYYVSLASLYKSMGKYEEAIKVYRKYIQIIPPEENTEKGEACRETANIYKFIGQKDNALKYYLEAIKIENMNIDTVILNYLMTGNFYLYQMDDPDKALKYYEIALGKVEYIGMAFLKDYYRSVCIKDMAMAMETKGDTDKAIEYLEKTLQILEDLCKNKGQSFYYETGLNYGHLGRIYEKKGYKEKALDCLNKALNIAKETGNRQLTALAYTNLGKFFFNQKQYEESLTFYMKAIKIAEEINSINRLTYYRKAGDIYEQTGQKEKALHFYLKSIEVIEGIRNEMKVEEFKRDFMKDNIETYEKAIDLFISLGRYEDGFNCNEQARARSFLDIIANQKVNITHGIEPELAGKEEELGRRIQYLSQSIRQAKENNKDDKIKEEELKALKYEYEQILEEIKLKNPEYASLISVSPVSLKDIRKIPDKDSVIIEYFLGKKRSYIWITGNEIFKTVIIPYNEEEIKNSVRQYRDHNCEHMTAEKLKNNKWQDEGKKLYSMLFKDAEKHIKGKKRLLIAPHKFLNYLPFQVFIDESGKSLAEKYEITYLPSAGVLKYCKDKNRMAKDTLLAFELGNFKIEGFAPLPGTEREVNSISKLYSRKKIYKGKNMNTDILYKKGREFDILHFATHATLDSSSPMFSSLVFSDKTLPVYEIFNVELSAYLVTLSACKTGICDEGDELVGLSRAFIYAGTPTICASLWDVSDTATSDLMERFYYYLKNHSKSEAMKNAQVDMMKKYHHPFFWAPFVLTGDWE